MPCKWSLTTAAAAKNCSSSIRSVTVGGGRRGFPCWSTSSDAIWHGVSPRSTRRFTPEQQQMIVESSLDMQRLGRLAVNEYIDQYVP